MSSTGFVVHLHTIKSLLSFRDPNKLWAFHMSDKGFWDPKLLGELSPCILPYLANELGLDLSLHFTQQEMVIVKNR